MAAVSGEHGEKAREGERATERERKRMRERGASSGLIPSSRRSAEARIPAEDQAMEARPRSCFTAPQRRQHTFAKSPFGFGGFSGIFRTALVCIIW
jgi:hypothetical protein